MNRFEEDTTTNNDNNNNNNHRPISGHKAPPPPPPQTSTTTGTNSAFVHCHNLLDKLFINCSNDPVGNVHRTWSITLLMIAIYLIITIFQIMHLHASNRNSNNNSDESSSFSSSSPSLLLACIWHGMMQFIMIGLMGTFIMKRFPTSFAIGFLFGMVMVFINQNLIYMIAFSQFNHDNNNNNDGAGNGTSRLYSAFSLLLAVVLCMFGALLFHFQKYIIVAPIDAKGFPSRAGSPSASTTDAAATTKSSAPTTTYQRYDDGSDA